MDRVVCRGLILSFVLCLFSGGGAVAKKEKELRTEECTIERVRILTLGSGGDAEQLVFLLEDQLISHGFEVVEDVKDAEGLLSGVTTTKEKITGGSRNSEKRWRTFSRPLRAHERGRGGSGPHSGR